MTEKCPDPTPILLCIFAVLFTFLLMAADTLGYLEMNRYWVLSPMIALTALVILAIIVGTINAIIK